MTPTRIIPAAKLSRNSSPGALTRRQAAALERKRNIERRAAYRKAAELAAQGRGGDTELAHLTPGEIVLPEVLQTPELLAALVSSTCPPITI